MAAYAFFALTECLSSTLASLGNMAYKIIQPANTNEQCEMATPSPQPRGNNMRSSSHPENVNRTGLSVGDSARNARRTASDDSIVSHCSTCCSTCVSGLSRRSSYTSVSGMSVMEEGVVAGENVDNGTNVQVHYDNSKNCKPSLGNNPTGVGTRPHSFQRFSNVDASDHEDGDEVIGTGLQRQITNSDETKTTNHAPHKTQVNTCNTRVLDPDDELPDQSLQHQLTNCDDTRLHLNSINNYVSDYDDKMDQGFQNEQTDADKTGKSNIHLSDIASDDEVMDQGLQNQLANSMQENKNIKAKRFNPPPRLKCASESKNASNENNNRNNSHRHSSKYNRETNSIPPHHSRNSHCSNSAPSTSASLRENNNKIIPHRKALNRNVASKRHATPSPEVLARTYKNDHDETTSGTLKPSEKRQRSCKSNQNNKTQQASKVRAKPVNEISEQEMKDLELALSLQEKLNKELKQVNRRKGTSLAYELRSHAAP